MHQGRLRGSHKSTARLQTVRSHKALERVHRRATPPRAAATFARTTRHLTPLSKQPAIGLWDLDDDHSESAEDETDATFSANKWRRTGFVYPQVQI